MKRSLSLTFSQAALLVTMLLTTACASSPETPPETPFKRLTAEKLLASGAAYSTLFSSRPVWLPDGSLLLTTMTEVGTSVIEHVELATGERTRLVEGTSPTPSADGSRIAYVGGDGNLYVTHVMGTDTAGTTRVVTLPASSRAFGFPPRLAWSPDGTQLAYTVIDLGARLQGEVGLVEVATGASTVLLQDDAFPFISYLAWIPGETGQDALALVRGDDTGYNGQVVRLDVLTQQLTLLRENIGGAVGLADVSPDGKQLAYYYDETGAQYGVTYHGYLEVIPTDGGEPRRLTHEGDFVYLEARLQWAADGLGVFYGCKERVFRQLCFAPLEGERATVLREPLRDVGAFAWSATGQLAYLSQGVDGTAELNVHLDAHEGDTVRLVSDLTPPGVSDLERATVHEVSWRSFDGLELPGLLIYPIGYVPGRRYPLLTDVHGGPNLGVTLEGSILLDSPLEWHYWATLEYMVFVPDFRTSLVAGYDLFETSRLGQSVDQDEFQDVMTGIDALIARGLADPDALFLLGHSHGGSLANWALIHTDRFNAVVSKESGGVDILTFYHEGDAELRAYLEWQFLGSPDRFPEVYDEVSLINHVDKATTPVLFLTGEFSAAVDIEPFAEALTAAGVETAFVSYPGEGHVFDRPESKRDALERVQAWFEQHTR